MAPKAIAFDSTTYSAGEILRDGSSIEIRAIRPDDKERLVEHAKRLSPESVYHRFMSYKRDLSAEELKRFTELDFIHHVGLAAIRNDDGREHIVGVGRYIRTSDQRAEVAFSVVDELQGHGVGTVLLSHLSRIASQSGITEFEADVMGDNVHMLDILTATGFRKHSTYDSGVVHVTMRIDQSTKS
jgi:GNAT superfamily N-acetyltransferase